MEENQPKTGKFSLNYGLILGLISVAFGIMLYSMDAHTTRDTTTQVISILIMIAITFWGIYSFRKANNGYLSLGEALKLGAGIALIAGIIAVIYTAIMANVIDPDFATKVAEIQKAADEAAGEFSSEQIQQRYDGTINYFWISYPFILIINIVIGLVIGLVGGLILKKQKPAY
jgi:preprotein translocase subunit YajC